VEPLWFLSPATILEGERQPAKAILHSRPINHALLRACTSEFMRKSNQLAWMDLHIHVKLDAFFVYRRGGERESRDETITQSKSMRSSSTTKVRAPV
jgi:hypothetical protein